MSFFPDMGCESLVAWGDHVRAIGWLHPDHPYTKGEISAEFLACLKEFAARCGQQAQKKHRRAVPTSMNQGISERRMVKHNAIG